MKEKKPHFRCAVYTRKSTDEGLEQSFNSLHAQREACEAYIKSQAGEGWNLIRTVYDDGGFSGGSMIRPAMQQLMTDVDAGLIDVVVVYKVDRLTRSLADFAKIVERFEKHGVSFVSVTQSFNTTTSMGRLTLNVLLSFAQFEREVAGERIRDKIAASRRKGMFMGGSVPTGYDVVKRKLIENPDDAETVRGIFQRYLELGSTRLLQRELKANGVVSKSARAAGIGVAASLSIGAINYLLRNRVYIGESLHKDIYYPGEHQAIVPKKLFDQVQDLIAAKRRLKFNRAKTKLAFPLTGLIYDDRGNPMAPGHSQKRGKLRYRYYVSRALIDGNKSEAGALPRVPAQAIEDLVAQYLRRTGLVESDENATESNQRIVRRVTIGAQKIWIHIDAEIVSNVYSRSHTGTFGVSALARDGKAIRVDAKMPEGTAQAELFLAAPAGYQFSAPVLITLMGGTAQFEAKVLFSPDAGGEANVVAYTLVTDQGAVSGEIAISKR